MTQKARMRFGTETVQEERVEVPVEEQQSQELSDKGILELVAAIQHLEDAPDYDILSDWKSTYGIIYSSTITMGDDIFIFRPLKRLDYKKIVASGAAAKEDKLEEAIVKKCLLWPQPDAKFIAEANAGVITTLRKQIEFKSGFIPDEFALSLIRVI